MRRAILIETPNFVLLVRPVSSLPLYALYVYEDDIRFGHVWHPWDNFGHRSGDLVTRETIGVLRKYLEKHFGAHNIRNVSRLEALIKYGFVTE